jgi:hypothetical protein
MTDEMRRCIETCHECHTICTETVPHCLGLGGEHATPQHITTLLDCATICETSADFMARGSSHHGQVCDVCATVCRACEEECRRLGDDDMMQRCADACARCAESCERMAAMT